MYKEQTIIVKLKIFDEKEKYKEFLKRKTIFRLWSKNLKTQY